MEGGIYHKSIKKVLTNLYISGNYGTKTVENVSDITIGKYLRIQLQEIDNT
ncbi:hypothetical protein FACS1894113_5530 [Alphaproteobacteria bacterium]|nr:hypothetical protein FACS1894113_5530 [Alphaproteobacteria bacterium]